MSVFSGGDTSCVDFNFDLILDLCCSSSNPGQNINWGTDNTLPTVAETDSGIEDGVNIEATKSGLDAPVLRQVYWFKNAWSNQCLHEDGTNEKLGSCSNSNSRHWMVYFQADAVLSYTRFRQK